MSFGMFCVNLSCVGHLMMQAERDFSIKNALESPHKKLAGPDYFRSVMFLPCQCNKKHLLPLVTGGAIEPRTAHFVDLLKTR